MRDFGMSVLILAAPLFAIVAAQQTTTPIRASSAPDRTRQCLEDKDCAGWAGGQRCSTSKLDHYLYTYNFGSEFGKLPGPFMPSSGKGCNLILRPAPEVSLHNQSVNFVPTIRSYLQKEAGEKNLLDKEKSLDYFQAMLAFPYCAQRNDQLKNQKQPHVEKIAIEYETKPKGNGPWYILEKLRNEGNKEVHGERLYRVEKDGSARLALGLSLQLADQRLLYAFNSELKGINPKKLRFPSPYIKGVGEVEEGQLQAWRERFKMGEGVLQDVEKGLSRAYVYVDRTSKKSCHL